MTDVLDADLPLRLPDPPAPPRRGAVPLVASVVPVLGALGLWLATGTVTMLWFAALGPLIAVASLADGARAARRQRRRAERDADRARRRVRAAVQVRHETERTRLWTQTPDVLRLVDTDAPDPVWRPVSGGGERIVVGRGTRPSAVRIDGGQQDPASSAVRADAAALEDAPITVPLRAGVAVVGAEPLARAVVRALILQVCHLLPPDRVRLSGVGAGDREAEWVNMLPHTRSDAPVTVAVAADEPADAVIVAVPAAAAIPPRCAAVLTLTGVDRARLAYDGTVDDVRIEGLGHGQALELAERLRERARGAFGGADEPVALADIVERGGGDDFGVVVGTSRTERFRLDLVADGPHAVVAGMTGSGKSELLTTWITALCTRFDTSRVTFLLADFKGGTAFDALADVPHVTGVITDLDTGGAARALQSLRAELRRREAEIVRAGAREITGTDLPRLVIVVDEFAALAAAHPDLVDLFTDIAARGRALGMHLILGTQRAAGTFRDALLANCPLRISLRVTDPADSRALIGGDEAAALSGAEDQRGVALVRRARDATARPVRIALTSAELIASAAAAAGPAPRRPWLPALPERVPLAGLAAPGAVVLGLADEPEHQRQSPVVLPASGLGVIGRAGSGRTTLLATLAAQRPGAVLPGSDPEAAWDAVARLEGLVGASVLVDDVDALLAQFPPEYAQAFAERLERVIHAAGTGDGFVAMSARRMGGAAGRLLELLPQRMVLATASRADFVAAGGSPHLWRENPPAGRGVLDGRLVQVALAPQHQAIPPEQRAHAASPQDAAQRRHRRQKQERPPVEPATWTPAVAMTAVIATAGAAQRRWEQASTGSRVLAVGDDATPAAVASERVERLVVIGDGEQWQRAWRLLQTIRADGELVVDAASAPDYRMLTGDRTLLPYCRPGRGRGWRIDADGRISRVVGGV